MPPKGLTYEEYYGLERALEIKTKQGLSRLDRPPITEETRQKMRLARLGAPGWNKGLTKETDLRIKLSSEKMAKSKLGKSLNLTEEQKLAKAAMMRKFWRDHPDKLKAMNQKSSLILTGRPRSEEDKAKMRGPRPSVSGPQNPRWKGGISYEPYGEEFNDELKAAIRKRDNYHCRLCGIAESELPENLSVHHVADDKKNSNPNDLLSLCRSCHAVITANKIWRAKLLQEVLRFTPCKFGPILTQPIS